MANRAQLSGGVGVVLAVITIAVVAASSADLAAKVAGGVLGVLLVATSALAASFRGRPA